MTMSPAGRDSMHSEINVTPMIDVLLVLLIIFMVIVPLTPKGETALAPRPLHDARPQEDAVVLEVLKGEQGRAMFRINQQAVSLEELPSRLASIFANRVERVLFIKGDDRLNFTEVAEAIDIGHAAGIDRIGLITPRVARGL